MLINIQLNNVKSNDQILIEHLGYGIVEKILGDPYFIGCPIKFKKYYDSKKQQHFENKVVAVIDEKIYLL